MEKGADFHQGRTSLDGNEMKKIFTSTLYSTPDNNIDLPHHNDCSNLHTEYTNKQDTTTGSVVIRNDEIDNVQVQHDSTNGEHSDDIIGVPDDILDTRKSPNPLDCSAHCSLNKLLQLCDDDVKNKHDEESVTLTNIKTMKSATIQNDTRTWDRMDSSTWTTQQVNGQSNSLPLSLTPPDQPKVNNAQNPSNTTVDETDIKMKGKGSMSVDDNVGHDALSPTGQRLRRTASDLMQPSRIRINKRHTRHWSSGHQNIWFQVRNNSRYPVDCVQKIYVSGFSWNACLGEDSITQQPHQIDRSKRARDPQKIPKMNPYTRLKEQSACRDQQMLCKPPSEDSEGHISEVPRTCTGKQDNVPDLLLPSLTQQTDSPLHPRVTHATDVGEIQLVTDPATTTRNKEYKKQDGTSLGHNQNSQNSQRSENNEDETFFKISLSETRIPMCSEDETSSEYCKALAQPFYLKKKKKKQEQLQVQQPKIIADKRNDIDQQSKIIPEIRNGEDEELTNSTVEPTPSSRSLNGWTNLEPDMSVSMQMPDVTMVEPTGKTNFNSSNSALPNSQGVACSTGPTAQGLAYASLQPGFSSVSQNMSLINIFVEDKQTILLQSPIENGLNTSIQNPSRSSSTRSHIQVYRPALARAPTDITRAEKSAPYKWKPQGKTCIIPTNAKVSTDIFSNTRSKGSSRNYQEIMAKVSKYSDQIDPVIQPQNFKMINLYEPVVLDRSKFRSISHNIQPDSDKETTSEIFNKSSEKGRGNGQKSTNSSVDMNQNAHLWSLRGHRLRDLNYCVQ
jgi:hypothetical protein